ncbi:MAG TPA: hypothetical protein DIC57_02320 [Sphaerochaeta sp.]|nr:hypothetical protein [Sphaerochaeta sp.]
MGELLPTAEYGFIRGKGESNAKPVWLLPGIQDGYDSYSESLLMDFQGSQTVKVNADNAFFFQACIDFE